MVYVKDEASFGANVLIIQVETGGGGSIMNPFTIRKLLDNRNHLILELIKEILENIKHTITHSPHLHFSLFELEDILTYVEREIRCMITNVVRSRPRDAPNLVCGLAMSFEPIIAEVLGFELHLLCISSSRSDTSTSTPLNTFLD